MVYYPAGAPVPGEKRTHRLLLRPLRAADVELDYDAVMSSAEQLRRWSPHLRVGQRSRRAFVGILARMVQDRGAL